ncbi:MAG: hypothetical protein HYW77_00785 [Parcubacteria group bacterium]|nr:hypothetical protein [Parcubacteria group bacterium]
MPQMITIPRLNNQIQNLQKEIQNLRSLVIGMAGKDKEGQYKPSFIKKILQSSQEKVKNTFSDKDSFLLQLTDHD